MFERIVIPVDGSDEATHAARRGLALARAFDAAVDVIHVVPTKALRLTRKTAEKTRLRERGEQILTEIDGLAAEFDRSLSTELVEGKPGVQISEFAAEQNADLIVIGRQGMTGLGRRLLGGVTEQVLHRSDVPVLVVPGADLTPDTADGYSRVLIPTDGSENAEVATRYGTAIARNDGADVHVLNVVDLQAAGGMFDAGGLETEFVDRLKERGREAVDRVVAGIDETDPELTVQTAVEQTSSFTGAAAGIRDYVDANDIELVVMGSHGRSNLKRQLLGSVASTVLRTVDTPVLIVKREA